MKTKYFLMVIVAVLMGTEVMNAQQKPSRREMRKRMTMEVVAERQASKFVNEWGLDDKTAARFIEVYKQYMKEQDEVRKEFAPDFAMKGKVEEKKDDEGAKMEMKLNAPTDEMVDKMMRDRFKQSRKMLDIREKYYDEFCKFLSPKQVQKIYEQGGRNQGKFRLEVNRRAGMKNRESVAD